MTIMTPADFRNAHGDPASWTPADHDEYAVLSEISPPLFSAAEMEAVAADHAWSAAVRQRRADRLAAEGNTEAATVWARAAREAREYADAAGQGWWHYQAVISGW